MQLNARVVGHQLMGQTAQSGADTFVCVALQVGAQSKAKTWKQSYAKLYMSQADAERSFPLGGYVRIETAKAQGELDLGASKADEEEPAEEPTPRRQRSALAAVPS